MKNDYKKLPLIIFIMLFACLLQFTASAQPNSQKIPFQGVLYEAGEPVTDTKQIIFSIAAVSWTETHSVSVVNGLYSVVLGEITPFPEDLFATENTASLGINVAGSALPPVEIHAAFLNEAIVAKNMPDQVNALSITVSNDNGDKRGELINNHSGDDAGSLRLYGANDNRNVILGSSGGGQSGLLGLYDPEGNPGIDVRVWNDGTGNIYTYGNNHFQTGQLGGFSGQGFLKIQESNNDETIKHAVAAGFWSGRPELILELGSNDQKVNINIGNDPDGDDPDGFSGGMTLRGPNSLNIDLSSRQWENADLPWLAMYGAQKDANDQATPVISMGGYVSGSSGENYGRMTMFSTSEGGDDIKKIEIKADGSRAYFLNEGSTRLAEIGAFSDNSGYSIFRGPNESKNIQMGGSDANRDLGMFRLSGRTENNLVNLEIQDWDTDDDQQPDTEIGTINLRGTDGSEFGISSHGFTGDINMDGDLISSGNRFVMNAFGLNGDDNAQFNVVEILNGQTLGSGAGEIKLFANDGNMGVSMNGWGELNVKNMKLSDRLDITNNTDPNNNGSLSFQAAIAP